MATFDFIEGFDYYPNDMNVNGLGVHSTWINTGVPSPSYMVGGRFAPGKAIHVATSYQSGYHTRLCNPSKKKAFGFAFRPINIGANPGGFGRTFMLIGDQNGGTIFEIAVSQIGQLSMSVAGGCQRLLLNNTWHYLEFLMDLEDGNLQIYIDGKKQFDIPLDPAAYAGRLIGRYTMWHFPFAFEFEIDDMYSQSDATAVLGESRIQLLEAESDFDVDFTGNPGGGNYANIDDSNVDFDGTYNYSNNAGDKDLFGLGNLAVNPDTIHAVGLIMGARKEDSGTRIVKNVLRVGQDDVSGHDENLTTDYIWVRDVFPKNVEGEEWTPEQINDLKAGYALVL